MNTFENDLSLYPDFDEATEGLKDVVSKVAEKVNNLPVVQTLKKLAKAFGDWLLKQLHKLVELGKALKRNKMTDPKVDKKASDMATGIANDVAVIAASMESILNSIATLNEGSDDAKNDPYTTNKQKEASVNSFGKSTSKCYEQMNETLQKYGEIALKLKQLPRMNMSYETCGRVYGSMKKVCEKNSKMYNIVGRINTGIESGALDSKQKALSKFLSLYQKLRKCTEALLAKFNGMSSSDSNVSKQIDRINKENEKLPDDKKKNPIDEVAGKTDEPGNNLTNMAKDIKNAGNASKDAIKKKLSDPKFTKLNDGNPINVDEWIEYIINSVKKDAKDNPKDKKKQLIAEKISQQGQECMLYVLSKTSVANVKKWLNSSANESVSSDDLDFTNIIYENIRESVLEDAYLEAEEAADMAFEGLETEEETDDSANESTDYDTNDFTFDDFDFLTDSE